MKMERCIGWAVILYALTGSVNAAREGEEGFSAANAPAQQRHTLKELRDLNVVKQKLDYSCGAAALATLMTYYYGEETSEQELLDLLNIRLQSLSEEERASKKRIGFSLLDLKIVAQQKGFQADGFKVSVDHLRRLKAPVLVYIRPLDYHHFAVLRGLAGDRVLLADPSRGNVSMHTARFAKEYGGVVFALGRSGEADLAHYPLAMSRLLAYAPPEKERVIRRLDRWEEFTINMAAWFRPF